MAGFQRILKNLGAMFTSRLLTTVQQLIVPPIFIHRYSTAQFGEWGVLSGAVAALSMLNFGVQTYMAQDLAVRFNRGDFNGYHIRQSTALRLMIGIILAAMMVGLVVFALPLDTMLKLDIGRRAAQWTVYLLGCQVLLNILYGYFTGIFMGIAQAHRGVYWTSAQALLSSLGLLVCVWLRLPFPVLAGVQLTSMVVCILGCLIDIRQSAPTIFPRIKYWDPTDVKNILKPSGYFGLITLATFFTYQAPLLIMQRILGPVAVASFIIMRLIFSMCRQILAMFTQSMGPEITTLFARKEWKALSLLYDYSERLIFFLIPCINTGVLLLSPILITVWMHKRAELFSPFPYMLSAAISMVVSLKEHKYQFQFSTNTHIELARIMFFSYFSMAVVAIPAVHYFGVSGFLWTWLGFELMQMVRIIQLNQGLFSGMEEPLHLTYLWRLAGICVPALLLSLLVLRGSGSLSMPVQVAVAVVAGGVVAGVSWLLFGVREVVKQMSGKFLRNFGGGERKAV